MAHESSYSGSETGWDLVVDVDKIGILKDELSKASGKIEELVAEIYADIYSIGGNGNDEVAIWSGESYEAFKSKCDELKPALESLALIIRAYGEMISDELSPLADTLIDDVRRQLMMGE